MYPKSEMVINSEYLCGYCRTQGHLLIFGNREDTSDQVYCLKCGKMMESPEYITQTSDGWKEVIVYDFDSPNKKLQEKVDLYIKSVKAAEFIQLQTIITTTGANFEDVSKSDENQLKENAYKKLNDIYWKFFGRGFNDGSV